MGTEKLLGYPLAVAASLAIMSPQPVSSGDQGMNGAGGGLRNYRPHQNAPLVATPTYCPTETTPPRSRAAAESTERYSSRAAESEFFPKRRRLPGEVRSADTSPEDADKATEDGIDPEYDISRPVVAEIEAAPDWLKGLERPDIAVPRNKRIAKYIRHFSKAEEGRAVFSSWLRRSGAYRRIVSDALDKRKLPQDLMAVMFVESGCWPKAVSSAGAAGLWQFMPQTARAYGLTVRPDYDERRSIWKSTDAALNHLADLYNQFQSWHLALAAYNLGYQGLQDRMLRTNTEDFFSLVQQSDSLPAETAAYVPKILAVALILRNLEYFGFDDVEQLPALSASRINVPPNTELSLLARAAGTSVRKLRELNPQFLSDEVPDFGGNLFAYLPNGGLARAKVMLPRLLSSDQTEGVNVAVTSDFDWGQDELDSDWKSRLSKTASASQRKAEAKAKVKTAEGIPFSNAEDLPLVSDSIPHTKSTMAENATGVTDTLRRAGMATITSRASNSKLAYVGATAQASAQNVTYYQIKPGDTLAKLAQEFDVPQSELARTNGIRNHSLILVGARLRVRTKTDSPGSTGTSANVSRTP